MANPVLPSIQTILQTAQIRQYLAMNGIATAQSLQGGFTAPDWGELIYGVRVGVQNHYNLFGFDSTMGATSNYLFQLVAPAITVNTNLLATNLTIVSVTSTTIALQWNSVPNGVTYTIWQTTDPTFTTGITQIFSGSGLSTIAGNLNPLTTYYFRAQVSAPGFTSSPFSYANATTLQQGTTITGQFYYQATDPYPTISGGSDPFIYQLTFNITHNTPIVVSPLPSASTPNQFLVIKIPSSETIKTKWFNTNFNNGTIPDSVFQSPLQVVALPGFVYYITRTGVSLDVTQPLTLS